MLDGERLIDAANAGAVDHLEECHISPTFCSQKGICYDVSYTAASGLTGADKSIIFDIFENNMRADYETTWGTNCVER